ncbi:MAG: transcription initiation factor IIB [Chloroflexi bacterium]|nr:transcription initiation factor IIB [Chloroflexota bacterium]
MDDSFNGRCIYCGVICPDMETLQGHMKKCPYKIPREKREENEWPYGKPLTESTKKFLERTRTWDSKSADNEPVDRNFRQAFSELNRLKDKLAISESVVEKAAYIYRKALDKGLQRERALMAACVYVVCRDTDTPHSLKEVEIAADIKRKDIAKCYRLLVRELDLEMPVTDPVQCVARIASKIGITEKTKRFAVEVLKIVQENEAFIGKDPMGLAAAALYLSCVKNGEDKTQRDIAEAANVTEVQIQNRYKDLKESIDV